MRKTCNLVSAFFLTSSFIGLILLAALVSFSPSAHDLVSWRKPLLGTVFSLICILGILAGIYPSKCSSMFHFRRPMLGESVRESVGSPKKPLTLRGHHPDCGNFGAHVFQTGEKVFCAGCIGLIVGAALSLVGVILYFLLDLSFWTDYPLVFWTGFTGVSCGLLQYHLFNWGRSSIHLSINTYFVFSVFLLLVGVDAITQSVTIGLYLIALSAFWLYVRILFSQLDHRRTCTKCGIEECGFSQK